MTSEYLCGSSSVGRASAFQAGCREFESRLPLIKKESFIDSFLIYMEILMYFFRTNDFAVETIIFSQSAMRKGLGDRKFHTNNHFISPESPFFKPTRMKHSLTCPNSVHKMGLEFLGTSGIFFT